MKNIAVIMGLACALGACADPQTSSNHVSNTNKDTSIADASTHADAVEFVDLQGTYAGKLPCAGCEAIRTKLTITNSNYTKETEYVGKKEKPTIESGTFQYDPQTLILTLDEKGNNERYLVGENKLTMLVSKGNEVDSKVSGEYELKKVL